MRKHLVLVFSVAIAAASCGGGDDDSVDVDTAAPPTDVAGDDQVEPDDGVSVTEATTGSSDDAPVEAAPPADLPAACVEAPMELAVTIDGFPQAAGTLDVQGAAGTATPIVPNGDGSLDDLDVDGFAELGAETDLLTYTQWIGDFAFGVDDLGFLGGPPPIPGDNIALGLSVTPTTASGLVAGDVVSSDDELDYDSITTFGTATVFLSTPEDVPTYLYTSGGDETHGGTATVLYVDDDWLCVDWNLAGATADPDGSYSVVGVVLTPIERGETPFT